MDAVTRSKLDFTGSSFDPTFALQHHDQAMAMLPCKVAKVYNNLDEYYKKTIGRSSNPPAKQQVVTEPERKFTKEQIAACTRPAFKWKDPPDVLNKMDKATFGPISVLHKFLGKRVKLMIRRRKLGPVESHFETICAQLVAFDKHINLILFDVDRLIKCPKQDKRKHVNKMFLRGESIVYVSGQ